jgi:hypothetical protein
MGKAMTSRARRYAGADRYEGIGRYYCLIDPGHHLRPNHLVGAAVDISALAEEVSNEIKMKAQPHSGAIYARGRNT